MSKGHENSKLSIVLYTVLYAVGLNVVACAAAAVAALANSQEQLLMSKQLQNYESDGPKTHARLLLFVPFIAAYGSRPFHDICRA